MDLAQHAAVLWRFRAVVAGGLVLGIVLAVLAAYQLPSLTPRGSETWTSESSLLVTQAGFPEGRSTLPTAGTARGWRGPGRADSAGQLEFADPDRLSALASLYAQLATGDRVRSQLPEKPKPAQIEAIPVEGNASTQLPVIKLTTTAGSGRGRAALNVHTVQALQQVLESEQTKNAIPAGQRIQITQINAPAAPVQDRGPLAHRLDTRPPAVRARRGCARASARRAPRRPRGHGGRSTAWSCPGGDRRPPARSPSAARSRCLPAGPRPARRAGPPAGAGRGDLPGSRPPRPGPGGRRREERGGPSGPSGSSSGSALLSCSPPPPLRVQANPILAAVVLPLVLVAYQRTLLAWQTLLGLLLAVILFIPIRRYTVGGGLPVELEPYRLLHRRRARVLAVRASAPTPRCAGARPASRRRSSRVHRRDPRLAGPERPARQRPRRRSCSSRSPSSSPSSCHLLRGERDRARPEARPDAPAARRRRDAARACCR